MSIEVNFYLKQEDETIPLHVEHPSVLINQLLKEGYATYGTSYYQYENLQIQKEAVNIFVRTNK
ncbi:hypothetical protein [Robertmurraya korlensis]|uniref:hypothetical protein n=1 Tax=Robertmurraya korlensis TaxID=519977 RepID=UPI0008261B18|nr:hypothetical protein [Robertmurraya korlensis]